MFSDIWFPCLGDSNDPNGMLAGRDMENKRGKSRQLVVRLLKFSGHIWPGPERFGAVIQVIYGDQHRLKHGLGVPIDNPALYGTGIGPAGAGMYVNGF